MHIRKAFSGSRWFGGFQMVLVGENMKCLDHLMLELLRSRQHCLVFSGLLSQEPKIRQRSQLSFFSCRVVDVFLPERNGRLVNPQPDSLYSSLLHPTPTPNNLDFELVALFKLLKRALLCSSFLPALYTISSEFPCNLC